MVKEFSRSTDLWIEWHNVTSSVFSEVAYLPGIAAADGLILLHMKNKQQVYAYPGFSKRDFDLFLRSASLGQYYNKHIKNNVTNGRPEPHAFDAPMKSSAVLDASFHFSRGTVLALGKVATLSQLKRLQGQSEFLSYLF